MSSRQLRQTRSSKNEFHPRLEVLEDRDVPAVQLSGVGTPTISITQVGNLAKNDTVSILDNGKGTLKITANFQAGTQTIEVSGVSGVIINLKGGNDTVTYALNDTSTSTSDAKSLSISFAGAAGNDTFTADLGGGKLRADRILFGSGGSENDKFFLNNVGEISSGVTLTANYAGNLGNDQFFATLSGDILGTVNLFWNGGGQSTGFFPGGNSTDKFVVNALNDVDVVKASSGGTTGKLTIQSAASNANVLYRGEVDGTVSVDLLGDGNKNTLVSSLTADADSNNVKTGILTGTVFGGANKDNLTYIVDNTAGSGAAASNTILNGGLGTDKGTVGRPGQAFITSIIGIENLLLIS